MKNKYYLYLFLYFFSFFLPFISSFSLSLAYNNNTNSSNITLLNLPLYFIENKGQIKEKIDNEEIKYYLNLPNQNILFTENSVYLTYYLKDNKVKTIKLSLNNKNKTKIIPLKKQEGKVNYFIGNNKENWKTDIDIYEAIIYKNVYDNVDIKFFTDKHKKLKYDIIINPPINIEKIEKEIKLTYYHLDDLYINKENNNLEGIVITNEKTKEKTIILNQEKPLIYQEKENENKKEEIKGQFNIIEKDKKNKKYTFSFKINENDINKIDKNKKLIIDPPIVTLYYSTYLGGNSDDYASSITVDNLGYIYITGYTLSTNFPTSSAFQGSLAGFSDAFVTKFSTSGNSLIFSTYLGGSGNDYANSITVDNSGYIYITGGTLSINFPLKNPYQNTNQGGYDIFISKLSEIRVQFTSSTVSNPESINTYLIEISLSSTSTEDIQVNYSIIGGTATVGQDYTLLPVSLIIPAGSTTTYLPINIINDDIDEPDETIILSIFSPTNALLGENTTFTYIILDDDLPSSPSSLSNNYVSGSNIYFQVKNLIEKNNKKQAEKLIKEYLHLFKKEKLLKEYPNLFTPQELTFIFTITGDIKNIENIEEIIKEVKEVKEKQETKKIIKTTNKYITLKQKLNSHPLKNYFINNCQSFKKTLKINTKDKEVKCLKIILNLDKETEIKGQVNKENNIFDNKTRLSLIKFQRKYNIKEERGIVGSKTRRILNEILNEIRR